MLWLVGTVGDAAAGLAQLRGRPRTRPGRWSTSTGGRFRSSAPARRSRPHAHAMMDVSDGLLLDAERMAEASGCAHRIELDALPLSRAFVAERGQDSQARLFAATGGDDYALLAALPPGARPGNTFFTRRDEDQPHREPVRRRAAASGSPAAASPSSCRRGWALSIEAISIAGFPLRQWLIGLSGLASGMALALLIR